MPLSVPSVLPSLDAQHLAHLLAQAPGFVAVLQGPLHRFEWVNPQYLQLVGHRDVLGKPVAAALPEAGAQGYLVLLDRVFRTGEPFAADSVPYDMQRVPDGAIDRRFVDFVYQPVRDRDGNVSGILVMGIDATDRVHQLRQRDQVDAMNAVLGNALAPAEAAFAASELLGNFLEASRVGYGTIDATEDTLEVHRDWSASGVASLAGVTYLRDYGTFIESLKKNELIAIADVRDDPRTSIAASALEEKSARSFVNVPVLERGRLVAVFFVNCAIARQWSDPELFLIRETAQRTRVTVERLRADAALRASEAKLRDANELLEEKVMVRSEQLVQVESQYRQSQKMEAIGQLTGGLAHDLNNLLQAMSMSLQVLRRRLERGEIEGWKKQIDTGLAAVTRAASLTHRMLALSRRQTLEATPANVSELVDGVRDLVASTIGPSIELVLRTPGRGNALVDRPQLENALLNLCINARDAMQPAGGSLVIEVADVSLDHPQSEGRPGPYVSVQVTDTGSGMAPDVAARAFDPFFTTKPLGQGTGLGLSMVYGFVTQSGGLVRIASTVGAGTSVTLYLPRIRSDLKQQPPMPEPTAPARGVGVVLVVEDEEAIREMLVDALSTAGYRVIAAGNALLAMEALRSEAHIDVLLTDIGLPGGLNGRELADALRIDRPDLAVVFITGYAGVDLFRDMRTAGQTAVLRKPFEMDSLLAKLAEFAPDGSRTGPASGARRVG